MSALPSWAVRGARVVCVNAEFALPDGPLTRQPMANEVLTISSCAYEERKVHDFFSCPAGVFLTFDEVPVSVGNWHGIRWPIEHFRPIVTLGSEAQDLAHFRKYLHQNAPEAVE